MSLPTVQIPTQSCVNLEKNKSKLYSYYHQILISIFNAYEQPIEPISEFLNVPILCELEKRGDFISPLIISQLEGSKIQPETVDYFFDCFSTVAIDGPASTYNLAKKSGLIYTKPISLNGQGGTEFAQSLHFLSKDTLFKYAVCVASQIVSHPDSRTLKNEYPFGDAAVATIITKEKMEGFSQFKILYTTVFYYLDLRKALKKIFKEINNINYPIQWLILQKNTPKNEDLIRGYFNYVKEVSRDMFQTVNFGSADVMISLYDALNKHKLTSDEGRGVLIFLGRHSTIACVVIEILP